MEIIRLTNLRIARNCGMEICEISNFRDFYEEYRRPFADSVKALLDKGTIHHSQFEFLGMIVLLCFSNLGPGQHAAFVFYKL